MESFLALAAAQPDRALAPGETLVVQGQAGGDLFVLETGELSVDRDGVRIATISMPGALIGEMAVLQGTPSSATVRAESEATVRVIKDARTVLEAQPALAFRLAAVMANRLDITSALLVDLTKQHRGESEVGILRRIMAALHGSGDEGPYVVRTDLFGSNANDFR